MQRAMLERMSARIAHRGPDGAGLFLNHENDITPENPQVGLVHRRLAIIDLDERANQPFTDGRGRWLVFNGEIYNYRELRKNLDYPWKTQSDTEVLLAAYDAWGEKCVDELNGMFAFAVWDGVKGELFLARDRMGQKPLYVATWPHEYGLSISEDAAPPKVIAFASEAGALLELPWVDRAIGYDELVNYLKYGYVHGGLPADNTIYRGIRQIYPSMCIRASAGRYHERRYYFQSCPEGFAHPGSDQVVDDREAVKRTRALVDQAVGRQMVADVPVGCFLSGGIDSSVIAAGMRKASGAGQSVMTFSIGFEDARYDESAYAWKVAEHLGTKHHEFRVTPDAAELLPKIAAAFGEPFADSSALPTYVLSEWTRRHVKVALSGDGGDELFGGYDRYRALALARRLRRLTTPIPWIMFAKMLGGTKLGHPKSRWTRAKRFFRTLGQGEPERYAGYMRFFPQEMARELIAFEAPPNMNFDLVMSLWGPVCSGDAVRTATWVDRESYLPYDLLTKVDRCSMRHALEVRSPFMDDELVKLAARLRGRQLIGGGAKRMLREAYGAELPSWVFARKKMGFAVPIGEWWRSSLKEMLRDHLFAADSFARGHLHVPVVERLVEEHQMEAQDHSQRLYALLMLELWWKGMKS